MFPETTRFDEAARFLLRQGGGPLLAWLLEEKPEDLHFEGWIDSVLSIPGTKERLCDAIARMETDDGAPHALSVLAQTRPDPSMLGRHPLRDGPPEQPDGRSIRADGAGHQPHGRRAQRADHRATEFDLERVAVRAQPGG